MGAPLYKSLEPGAAKCEQCPVRGRSFCRLAENAAFFELAAISHIKSFRSGETIIGQNDPSVIVGNVVSGVLKLVKSLSDGREQIVGLMYASDFFGRVFAGTSEFSLEAATNVELCVIDRNAFEALLARYPVIEHELYISSLGQLDSARERILLLACQNTLERVAAYLSLRLLQAERDLIEPGARLIVDSQINRRDLAGYLGTTVETISRNIQYLSRNGIIRILDSGHFEVLKRSGLIALSGQSEDDLALEQANRPTYKVSASPVRLAAVNPRPTATKMPTPPAIRHRIATDATRLTPANLD